MTHATRRIPVQKLTKVVESRTHATFRKPKLSLIERIGASLTTLHPSVEPDMKKQVQRAFDAAVMVGGFIGLYTFRFIIVYVIVRFIAFLCGHA